MNEPHIPAEREFYEDPDQESVFCLFPWLFRLYDRDTGYFGGNTENSENISLQSGRLTNVNNPRTSSVRVSRTFFPSRLVRPDGKVEIVSTFKTKVPDYVVISYTWGRWMHSDRSRDTNLEGCDWKVPSTTLFSREELDKAVRKIAGGQHAWLDVFCIPQGDKDPEKAQEISRQGDIFSNASSAAVWLCSGGESILQDICSWVDEDFSRPALDLAPSAKKKLKKGTIIRLETLRCLPSAIPWTTSLWTLQETALRRDAVFYSKDGQVARDLHTGTALTAHILIRAMTQIETELRVFKPIMEWMSIEERALFDEATSAVQAVALSNLSNMNARELYLASKHRVCQRDHDRVYAIMNALGVVVPVDYTTPVEKMQQEFLLELYRNYPAEMQSFIKLLSEPLDTSLEFGLQTRSLSQMRQSKNHEPPSSLFRNVTGEGLLVIDGALPVNGTAVESICSSIRHNSAAVCYDDKGQDRLISKEHWTAQQLRTARNLYGISKTRDILLIPLGVMRPTEHLGSNLAYILCYQGQGQKESSGPKQVYRIGLLVSKDAIEVAGAQRITVCFKP